MLMYFQSPSSQSPLQSSDDIYLVPCRSALPCMAQNRSDEEANTFGVGGPTRRISAVSTQDTTSAFAQFLEQREMSQRSYSQHLSPSSMLYTALSGSLNKLLFIETFKKQVSKLFIFNMGTSCQRKKKRAPH